MNNKRKDEITCIQLSKDTKSKLDDISKKKTDTYESIILGLLDRPSSCNMEEDAESEEESP